MVSNGFIQPRFRFFDGVLTFVAVIGVRARRGHKQQECERCNRRDDCVPESIQGNSPFDPSHKLPQILWEQAGRDDTVDLVLTK